ncbi:thread biopolymer filament subunit gamma [Acipenser ruthenus]|uniref:thread biopolymer filament subunit gamma n=1 Tax=Acipenser ruthenus TaxID=7906 RepID=UPI00274120E6|nr:thread biopolymer filament subunit gamma [Acipenser ruthenus]
MPSRISYQSSSSGSRGSGFRGLSAGYGLGAGSGLSASMSRMSLGGGGGLAAGGLGIGGSIGMGAGGLGMGSGYGLGGAGFGIGGSGMGVGYGLGMGTANMGIGMGSAGALLPSPAFAMGRTLTAGGLSLGSALSAGSSMHALPRPIPTRASEKHTLSSLNDRFSNYIDKVRFLQNENASLEAQLNQLTGGASVAPDSSVNVNYDTQLKELRTTMETLTLENIKFEIQLDNIRGTAEELKAKYDFEMGVKYQLEADIAAMKRDIETASDLRIDLESKYQSLSTELDFVTKTHEEELASLQVKLGSTTSDTSSVSMIEVDTVKSFDLSTALSKMRAEYEKSVQQHREEAESYFKLKMDEIQSVTVKSTEAISAAKVEVSVARKELQTLNLELQSLLAVNFSLEQSLAEAHAQSSVGVAEYQAQITSLESAIEVAKVDLHKQILSYQELLDVKLALDGEISTYRKLLEGDDLKLPDIEVYSGTYSFSVSNSGLQKKEMSITAEDTETSSIP